MPLPWNSVTFLTLKTFQREQQKQISLKVHLERLAPGFDPLQCMALIWWLF